MQKLVTFLMFEGKAEAAMNFYISLFTGSEIVSMERYGANEAGAANSVKHATFSLNGQLFMCIDSPAKHGFTFSPSMSIYVNCDTEAELKTLFEKLSENGNIFMPLAPYPFSDMYGWVGDQFGVAWQLNLTKKVIP